MMRLPQKKPAHRGRSTGPLRVDRSALCAASAGYAPSTKLKKWMPHDKNKPGFIEHQHGKFRNRSRHWGRRIHWFSPDRIARSRRSQVKALSLYNSFNWWGWLEDVDCRDKIEVFNGDIRDPHFCRLITKDVDIVFHLAALIAIPYSYVAPDSYVETNVKGTLNIAKAALDNGVKRLIQTSTSEVYGTACYVPINEQHPLQPQSPYSASKVGADAIAMSFFYAFNLPVTIARPFNAYGPRQSARAVIPTIITQIAAGKKKIELGDAGLQFLLNFHNPHNSLPAPRACHSSKQRNEGGQTAA